MALLSCDYTMSSFGECSLPQDTVTHLMPTGLEDRGKLGGGWSTGLGEVGGSWMFGNRGRVVQLRGRNILWMPIYLRLSSASFLWFNVAKRRTQFPFEKG